MLYAIGVEVVLKKILLWQTLMPRTQDGFAKRKVHNDKSSNQQECFVRNIYQIRSNIFQQKISIIIAPTTKTPQKSITTARTIATIEPGTIILLIERNKNFIIRFST